ncbi:MAG TPA: hypothetical protein VGQ62_06220 [Chloroflexota bacterium]|nr:hypothetical protein [Chloroflexota bacterium]
MAATLLFAGEILFILVGIFHPAREAANSHAAVFAEYAQSEIWTAVHLGQFLTTGVILAGFLILFCALNVESGAPRWLVRFGAVSVGVTFTLTGVLQAVDGVALKQAVDAWAGAPAAEQTVRFASAEAVRWLEWGVRSYQRIMLGLSMVLFATTIVWTARIPRLIGLVMGVSGVTYLIQGVIVGGEGFSATLTLPGLIAFVTDLVWMLWLVAFAWHMKSAAPALARTGRAVPWSALDARTSSAREHV